MRFRTIKLNRRIAGLRPLDIWPSSGYGCHNSKSRDQMTMEFVTIIDRYWYKNHCWIRRRSAMNVGCEIPFTDVCEGSSTENTTLFRSDFRTTLYRIEELWARHSWNSLFEQLRLKLPFFFFSPLISWSIPNCLFTAEARMFAPLTKVGFCQSRSTMRFSADHFVM
jgi:hypothetical protein